MSQNALVTGTITFLRSPSGLGLGTPECDEQLDGQPPPAAGQVYYAVHATDWSSDSDLSLDERFGLDVTITLRAGKVPVDRIGVAILRELRTRAEALRAKLHMSEVARADWNAVIGTAENTFVEPLKFTGADRPKVQGPDWFWAEGNASTPTGISMTLHFANARRLQVIDEQS